MIATISKKYLDRYVSVGRRNTRMANAEDQMAIVVWQFFGHCLNWRELIADNSLPSEARS